MCGFNGIFAYNHSANQPGRNELLVSRDHMTKRGPDAAGEWWNVDRRVGLGHRRLSILDLSDRASQPMESICGRYVVVFNGEIYNYPTLRRQLELKGREFRTNSDTEVLLHLFELKGERMVDDLRGMFAFAIWDNECRNLFLARDPYGIKPLYTANDGWTFRFASQVKALLAGGKISRDPEPAGVVGFHIWGSVPEPFTLYRDIRALPAGHTQWVDAAGPREPLPYCSITGILSEGASESLDAKTAEGRVREALRDSVRAHLLADVDVCLFLSRGVDSGALLGLAKDVGQERLRTITLGFSEFAGTADDEAPIASEIAALYGSNHTTRMVNRAEFRADLPEMLEAMDQPTVDGVNVWFVSKAAKEQGLKVALSGLGGDELFAGYPSFRDIPRSVRLLRLPAAIPGIGWSWQAALTLLGIGKEFPKLKGLLRYGGTYPGAYLLRRGLFLPSELNEVLEPSMVKLGLRRLGLFERLQATISPNPGSANGQVAALESAIYMRNQLLRDADWAGMAHSVEVRTPLVDVELLRATRGLVPHLQAGDGKRILGQAPTIGLPTSVVEAKKLGFTVPTGDWIKSGAAAPLLTRGQTSRNWARTVFSQCSFGVPSESKTEAASQVIDSNPVLGGA